MHLSSYGEMVGLPKDTVILITQLQWEVGVGSSTTSSPASSHRALFTFCVSHPGLPWLPGHCAIHSALSALHMPCVYVDGPCPSLSLQ